MTSADPILAVRNVGYTASSGQTLLKDVTFEVDRRTILAVAGPNGATGGNRNDIHRIDLCVCAACRNAKSPE